MDLFTLGNLSGNTLALTQGVYFDGKFARTWVERYRDPGEFKLEGELSSGLLDVLKEGTLISHTNTRDVMVVENIVISESKKENSKLEISGRSLESILEQRIVGSEAAVSNLGLIPAVTLAAVVSYTQAQTLIDMHTKVGTVADAGDGIPGLTTDTLASVVETLEPRIIKRGTVHERLMELLSVSNLGIRVLRPSSTVANTTFRIHNGFDRAASVVFSWEAGDLENTQYLFTSKQDKNAAFITGKAVYSRVNGTELYLQRRVMLVEANDVDESVNPPHATATWNDLIAKLNVRGREAMAAYNPIKITSVDISLATQNRYRVDYDIGDLVMVSGNYGTSQVMRVVEYAEIEDESGERGYPTLSIL